MNRSEVVPLRARRVPAEKPLLLRVEEAAARLGIHPRTCERWIAAGILPHVRLGPTGRIVRVPAEALEDYIRRQTQGGEST